MFSPALIICGENPDFSKTVLSLPLEIPGVNTNIFLKTSLNAVRKARGEKELDAIEFLKLVKKKSKELKFDEDKLNRQLNVGFSGGEKKKNEILQMSEHHGHLLYFVFRKP